MRGNDFLSLCNSLTFYGGHFCTPGSLLDTNDTSAGSVLGERTLWEGNHGLQSQQATAETECRSQVSGAHLQPVASEQPGSSKIWGSPFLPHPRKVLLSHEY